jgi:ABC-2 type transport system permease protein
MPKPFKLFYMALWRNFLTLTRYKANFLAELISSAVWAIGILVFGLMYDTSLLGEAVGSTNYVAFVILGVSYDSWEGTALWSVSRMFMNELYSGQIDYTFSSPFSRYWYIVSNIAASAAQQTLFFIPILCIGFLFTSETLTITGILLGLIATILSVAALAQLGSIIAALILRFKQITGLFGFFYSAFFLLTGMFIPIQLLPESTS